MDSRDVLKRMREAERRRIPLLLAQANQAALEGKAEACDALCAEAEQVAQREAALGEALRALDAAAVARAEASVDAVEALGEATARSVRWFELVEGQRWQVCANPAGALTVEILAIDRITGEVDILAERGRASCRATLAMADAMALFEGARLLEDPADVGLRH